MSGGIFVIEDNGNLVPMNQQNYDSEDLLQTFLAKYPSLLAGDQIESADPRRWLLVSREIGIPGEADGSNRWSLDHLFLDQDAIPTLVEVKRSSDTRIRREVVGQMLDYAANAVVYWPVEEIRAQYERQCAANQIDPEKQLSEFLGADEHDTFWQKAKTNLQAGKVRMIFVADYIPPELRRIVEFLNEQMDPAEVLALEIKQYVGAGMKSLVPRIIGQTAEAGIRKGTGRETRRWDETTFFEEIESRAGKDCVHVAKALLNWARPKATRLNWGKGKIDGSVYPMFDDERGKQYIFGLWTGETFEIPLWGMQNNAPFSDSGKRQEFLHRLNGIEGVQLLENKVDGGQKIPFLAFSDPRRLAQLLDVCEWAYKEIVTSRQVADQREPTSL